MKDERENINNLKAGIAVQEKTKDFIEDNEHDDLIVHHLIGSSTGSDHNEKPNVGGGGANDLMEAINDPPFTSELDYVKKTLKHFLWYHGLVHEEQVPLLLKWPNSFLVRYTYNSSGKPMLCLSIRERKETISNYALKWEADSWKCSRLFRNLIPVGAINKLSFAHIYNLIDYYSLINKSSVIPIVRAKTIFLPEDIISELCVGSGAFGDVWLGTARIDGTLKDCAIKRLKEKLTSSPRQIRSLLEEALITSTFNHPCVIGFLGLCTLITPPSLILELAVGGTVRNYMKANPDATLETMLSFIHDISRGMAHVVSKKIIHRDLATRNCLIGSRLIVKISDFGLSVRGTEIKVQNLKTAPIRWMSPETFNTGIFNEKTDVWSFGVTIWEIFTKCATVPLHPKTGKEAADEIKNVEFPHRMPRSCPTSMRVLVQNCHQKNPENRPAFHRIRRILKKMLSDCRAELNNELKPSPTIPVAKSRNNNRNQRQSRSAADEGSQRN